MKSFNKLPELVSSSITLHINRQYTWYICGTFCSTLPLFITLSVCLSLSHLLKKLYGFWRVYNIFWRIIVAKHIKGTHSTLDQWSAQSILYTDHLLCRLLWIISFYCDICHFPQLSSNRIDVFFCHLLPQCMKYLFDVAVSYKKITRLCFYLLLWVRNNDILGNLFKTD